MKPFIYKEKIDIESETLSFLQAVEYGAQCAPEFSHDSIPSSLLREQYRTAIAGYELFYPDVVENDVLLNLANWQSLEDEYIKRQSELKTNQKNICTTWGSHEGNRGILTSYLREDGRERVLPPKTTPLYIYESLITIDKALCGVYVPHSNLWVIMEALNSKEELSRGALAFRIISESLGIDLREIYKLISGNTNNPILKRTPFNRLAKEVV